jgi:hypothetical protein
MRLVLEAVIMELDPNGNLRTGFRECSEICESMDGTEIDGFSFGFSKNGNFIDLVMTGDSLSDEIRPNYPKLPLSPLMQISFRKQEAKLTANTLNKLMRRVNKEFPGKSIVIREVKSIE